MLREFPFTSKKELLLISSRMLRERARSVGLPSNIVFTAMFKVGVVKDPFRVVVRDGPTTKACDTNEILAKTRSARDLDTLIIRTLAFRS